MKIISLGEYAKLPEPRPLARLEQSNSRSHGMIVDTNGHDVWTMEKSQPHGGEHTKLWWCCHSGTEVELLDKPLDEISLPDTSNL